MIDIVFVTFIFIEKLRRQRKNADAAAGAATSG